MNIFGMGLPEIALIMMVALLVFGPKKLPEIGRSLGKAIRGFQDASKEFEAEFKRETERLEQVTQEPMQATLEPTPQASLSAASTTSPTPTPPSETVADSALPESAAVTPEAIAANDLNS